MTYTVVKVIKNENTDDFIGLCKKHFIIETLLSILMILACVFFGYFALTMSVQSELSRTMEIVRNFVFLGFALSFIPAAISFVMTFGNFSMKGAVWTRFSCKTLEDWLAFADKYTFIPYSVRLTKRLEVEEKEIAEVLLDSAELRCRDVNSGSAGIISLGKDMPFRKQFTIKDDPNLGDNEMVIDLSGKEPVSYVQSRDV